MIKPVKQYVVDEVRPRLWSILISPEVCIAVAVGLASGEWADRFSLGRAKVVDVIGGLLTYASIAFGFCLAGLTLALTLPDRQFAKHLATSKPATRRTDAYSELLFVFSWTAISHWVGIVAFICALAFGGPESQIMPSYSSPWRRAAVALVASVTAYGVMQFLITLITLSQVGRLYIQVLRGDDST